MEHRKLTSIYNTLFKEFDDTEETVKARLDVYAKQTAPLLEFYNQFGLVKTTDGIGDIDVIFNNIKLSLEVK